MSRIRNMRLGAPQRHCSSTTPYVALRAGGWDGQSTLRGKWRRGELGQARASGIRRSRTVREFPVNRQDGVFKVKGTIMTTAVYEKVGVPFTPLRTPPEKSVRTRVENCRDSKA